MSCFGGKKLIQGEKMIRSFFVGCFLAFRVFLGLPLVACASESPVRGAWEGPSGQPVDVNQWLERVQAGDVLIIGENHGLKSHQAQQLMVMEKLREYGKKVSVGLEFFNYTDQDYVHQYCSGELDEVTFLQKIKWGGIPFAFYREQARMPNRSEGARTLALNAPKSLTQKVSRSGLSSLTQAESDLLPPSFTLGRDSYRSRFLASVPHELPPEQQDNYFAAQSIWDDTMAWRAGSYILDHLDQVLVIIVGDFHASYGGGLPDRLRARGANHLWTISQVNSSGMSWSDVESEILPHPQWGVRADLILVEGEP